MVWVDVGVDYVDGDVCIGEVGCMCCIGVGEGEMCVDGWLWFICWRGWWWCVGGGLYVVVFVVVIGQFEGGGNY